MTGSSVNTPTDGQVEIKTHTILLIRAPLTKLLPLLRLSLASLTSRSISRIRILRLGAEEFALQIQIRISPVLIANTQLSSQNPSHLLQIKQEERGEGKKYLAHTRRAQRRRPLRLRAYTAGRRAVIHFILALDARCGEFGCFELFLALRADHGLDGGLGGLVV